MAKYPVLDSLVHDDKPYLPGEVVELTPKQAEVLKALKVVGEPLKDKPDAKPVKESKPNE